MEIQKGDLASLSASFHLLFFPFSLENLVGGASKFAQSPYLAAGMDTGGTWQVPWPGHNSPSVGPGGAGTEFLRCLFLALLPRSCPFFFLAQQHPVNIVSESTEHHVAFAVAEVDFHGHLLRGTLQLLDRSLEPLPVDDLAKGVLSKRRAISFRSRDDTSIEPQGSAQEPHRSRQEHS